LVVPIRTEKSFLVLATYKPRNFNPYEYEMDNELSSCSIEALTEKLQSVNLADNLQKQKDELACFARVEATIGAPRNILIHATEDKNHSFPHAISDLRKVFPDLDAALTNAKNVAAIDIRITFVTRLLDFCREHYYLLDAKQQKRVDKKQIVSQFLKAIATEFPDLDEKKRLGQFRNFLVWSCKLEWADTYVNDSSSLDEAYKTIAKVFRGNRTYASGEKLVQAAKESGSITGLSNFGQTLHILKTSSLKTREGNTNAVAASVKKLLNCTSIRVLTGLAEALADESGGLRYLALEAKDEDVEKLRTQASTSKSFALQVAPFVKERIAKTMQEVPDIGFLITDEAFINSIELIFDS
jgi:hypothetical protein